jgi:hypothetical protein
MVSKKEYRREGEREKKRKGHTRRQNFKGTKATDTLKRQWYL